MVPPRADGPTGAGVPGGRRVAPGVVGRFEAVDAVTHFAPEGREHLAAAGVIPFPDPIGLPIPEWARARWSGLAG